MGVVLRLTLLFVCSCSCESLPRSDRSDDPNTLEALVMTQAHTIQQLQAKISAMETSQQQATHTISQLKAESTSLRTDVNNLKTRLAKQETKVAFSARLSTHGQDVTGYQNIVFDAVDLNQGGAYDKVTGMFTAPVNGLYEFSIHISTSPPGRMQVMIVRNGGEVAETEASGDDTKYMDRASNSVLLHMTTGQRVWVKRASGDATRLQGDYRSSFSGVLIRAD
ncbi:hypothetical protein BaRGS_00002164 [Batillaria attramentaria]|uniref:C1q domain-containing protein n=1 Tax=Batillaria attramentaria TaxID=370345 RepID=A0ABD0M443_9CAEN